MSDDIEVHAVDEHGEHITRTVPGPPGTDHTLIPTAELAGLRAEVARLRAGESPHPAAEGAQHTPAEWIHRWNRATANERLAKVEQIFNDSEIATRCRFQDHGSVLHELANTLQSINRIRELHQPTNVEFARGPCRDQGETESVKYMRKCCSHCEVEGMGVPADWPCATIRALDGEPT